MVKKPQPRSPVRAGVGVDVTESLNIYSEVSFLTEDQSFTDDWASWN